MPPWIIALVVCLVFAAAGFFVEHWIEQLMLSQPPTCCSVPAPAPAGAVCHQPPSATASVQVDWFLQTSAEAAADRGPALTNSRLSR